MKFLFFNRNICRCTIVSVDKFHDPNAPRASKLGSVSYDEWKAGKEVAEGNRWGTYSKSPENPQKSVDNSTNNGKMNIGLQFFANKSIKKQNEKQLQKSIVSWKTNIEKHNDKISHPEKYDTGWAAKDERQRNGLINHWRKEIRYSEQNISEAENEIKERRKSKND